MKKILASKTVGTLVAVALIFIPVISFVIGSPGVS
ncbi:hypothetical protein CLROS_017540 [Clostridium felsineum]|uniref:Uncharacterized protein n=1 Tax=Clostridium felsineum TaxID=36839 RepID=A0A1S8MDN9_9CLOT|nr:hypothetical protein CLROS_017540 [Clostridium felsineum]URZ11456.1 hypothetical protein CROST_021730 [Clostridium felsineum]